MVEYHQPLAATKPIRWTRLNPIFWTHLLRCSQAPQEFLCRFLMTNIYLTLSIIRFSSLCCSETHWLGFEQVSADEKAVLSCVTRVGFGWCSFASELVCLLPSSYHLYLHSDWLRARTYPKQWLPTSRFVQRTIVGSPFCMFYRRLKTASTLTSRLCIVCHWSQKNQGF